DTFNNRKEPLTFYIRTGTVPVLESWTTNLFKYTSIGCYQLIYDETTRGPKTAHLQYLQIMITVLTNKIDFAANTSLVLEASSSRFYRGEYRSLYRKDLVTLFGELEQKKVKQSTREAA